jgi:ribosomal protein L37E
MGDYQVLFSGEVTRNANAELVRARLARELGIDERKSRALFSGRTVVIRSQLQQSEARALQERLGELGAICRIKSLSAPRPVTAQIDKDAGRMETHAEQTLKDITAAHIECPRCGYLQLESSHCARCGVDIAAATLQKRKEDLQIEKKIRELREQRQAAGTRAATRLPAGRESAPIRSDVRPGTAKRGSFVRDLFRRS